MANLAILADSQREDHRLLAADVTHTDSLRVSRRLLTAEDVAEVLGVPRSMVYTLARRGDLPAVRVAIATSASAPKQSINGSRAARRRSPEELGSR